MARKRVLVVVDFQHDFVDGALGFARAQALEHSIVARIGEYRESGDDVVFTLDTHTPDYLTTQEGQNLPVEHCIKGTQGWSLYGEVANQILDTDRRFEKHTFGSVELGQYLAASGYESVLLVGVATNICVIANAVLAKTFLPEALVVVDASCTASFDDCLHQAALDVMKSLQIAVVDGEK